MIHIMSGSEPDASELGVISYKMRLRNNMAQQIKWYKE